jgi:hypothetical protein
MNTTLLRRRGSKAEAPSAPATAPNRIAARVRAAHETFWWLPPIIVGLAVVTVGVGTGHLVLPLSPALW